jgi:hypothetical protein
MSQPNGEKRRYRVLGSEQVVQALRAFQVQAANEGRGEDALAAIRKIIKQLQENPHEVGEPLYRLPSLRMQICSVTVRPLVVGFGICEDRPIVRFQRFRDSLLRRD